jgi:hypothetical protein
MIANLYCSSKTQGVNHRNLGNPGGTGFRPQGRFWADALQDYVGLMGHRRLHIGDNRHSGGPPMLGDIQEFFHTFCAASMGYSQSHIVWMKGSGYKGHDGHITTYMSMNAQPKQFLNCHFSGRT